jgi:transposase-like protein
MQINACRTLGCPSYGKPTDPWGARDPDAPNYQLDSSGGTFALRCPDCGRRSSLLSNEAMAREIERLTTLNGKLHTPACPNDQCENRGHPVNRFRDRYQAYGKTPQGRPRYRCGSCRRTFTVGRDHRAFGQLEDNKAIVRGLVNRLPIRGLCRVLQLSPNTLYRRIDFLHRQMVAFEAARLRKLTTSKRYERGFFALGTDAQDQLVNWWSRDRREPV